MFVLEQLFFIIGVIYFFYPKIGQEPIGARLKDNFSSHIPMVQNIHYCTNKGWIEPGLRI